MLLDEFFLLVRRIPGLSMSLDDFWNSDCDEINYILHKELEIIKEEQKHYEEMELKNKTTSSTGTRVPNKYEDSSDMESALNSYFEE